MLLTIAGFAGTSYIPKTFSIISQVADSIVSNNSQNLPNYSYIFIQNGKTTGSPLNVLKLVKTDEWHTIISMVNHQTLTLEMFLNDRIKMALFLTHDLKNVIEIGYFTDTQTILLSTSTYDKQYHTSILGHRGPIVLKYVTTAYTGSSKWSEVKGIIYNDSNEPVESVSLEVEVYDKQMNLIDMESTYANPNTIQSYGKGSFDILFNIPRSKIGKVTVTVLG